MGSFHCTFGLKTAITRGEWVKIGTAFSDTLLCRSSCLQMIFKTSVLKNFPKLPEKHLYRPELRKRLPAEAKHF